MPGIFRKLFRKRTWNSFNLLILSIVILSERSERKGHRAVALAVQLPENLRFSVIPKRNSSNKKATGILRLKLQKTGQPGYLIQPFLSRTKCGYSRKSPQKKKRDQNPWHRFTTGSLRVHYWSIVAHSWIFPEKFNVGFQEVHLYSFLWHLTSVHKLMLNCNVWFKNGRLIFYRAFLKFLFE